jgi:AraC-like DNA-binding protein
VRTLQTFFLSALGDSPHRLLNRLRMQRAVELLRDSSTVKEIASALGYQDSSHFSRDFKAFYAFSPADYANRSLKGH